MNEPVLRYLESRGLRVYIVDKLTIQDDKEIEGLARGAFFVAPRRDCSVLVDAHICMWGSLDLSFEDGAVYTLSYSAVPQFRPTAEGAALAFLDALVEEHVRRRW